MAVKPHYTTTGIIPATRLSLIMKQKPMSTCTGSPRVKSKDEVRGEEETVYILSGNAYTHNINPRPQAFTVVGRVKSRFTLLGNYVRKTGEVSRDTGNGAYVYSISIEYLPHS